MPEPVTPARIEARHERSESARLDNFVDGAFAFAITLLIISGGSLPKNVAALEHALRGIPAFAACFLQLAFFWRGHVGWRDSVRLTDGTSLRLSLLLVFFALIFVFPLHLVYASFFSAVTGGALSPDFTLDGHTVQTLSALFICYGLSYACMAGTLAMLYRHAARHADLPPVDTASMRLGAVRWTYCGAIGLLSTLIALIALATDTLWLIPIAGFSYALLSFTGRLERRYRVRVEQGPSP